MEQYQKIAGETKKLLVSNLSKKLQEKGTIGAMGFCKIEATALTESMSEKHLKKVSRVSDKNRNPNNLANVEEIALIENYKNLLLQKKKLQPQIQGDYYYEPLVTNAMCLQCHGVPNQNFTEEASKKIKELYPTDKANGFSEN